MHQRTGRRRLRSDRHRVAVAPGELLGLVRAGKVKRGQDVSGPHLIPSLAPDVYANRRVDLVCLDGATGPHVARQHAQRQRIQVRYPAALWRNDVAAHRRLGQPLAGEAVRTTLRRHQGLKDLQGRSVVERPTGHLGAILGRHGARAEPQHLAGQQHAQLGQVWRTASR